MKTLLMLAMVLSFVSAPVLAGTDIFKPLRWGKRVPITMMKPVVDKATGNPTLGADGKPLLAPVASHTWDGDGHWLTVAIDETGAVNVQAAVCPTVADPANAALVPSGCRDGLVQDYELTADENVILTKLFKKVVLKTGFKSVD